MASCPTAPAPQPQSQGKPAEWHHYRKPSAPTVAGRLADPRAAYAAGGPPLRRTVPDQELVEGHSGSVDAHDDIGEVGAGSPLRCAPAVPAVGGHRVFEVYGFACRHCIKLMKLRSIVIRELAMTRVVSGLLRCTGRQRMRKRRGTGGVALRRACPPVGRRRAQLRPEQEIPACRGAQGPASWPSAVARIAGGGSGVGLGFTRATATGDAVAPRRVPTLPHPIFSA